MITWEWLKHKKACRYFFEKTLGKRYYGVIWQRTGHMLLE